MNWGRVGLSFFFCGIAATMPLAGESGFQEDMRRHHHIGGHLYHITVRTVITRLSDRRNWTSDVTKMLSQDDKGIEVRMRGDNALIAVLFSHLHKAGEENRDGVITVIVRSQIWLQAEEEKIEYHYTSNKLRLKLGEKTLFYPLGKRVKEGGKYTDASIEMELLVRPYE